MMDDLAYARGRLARYKDHYESQSYILAQHCMARFEEELKA